MTRQGQIIKQGAKIKQIQKHAQKGGRYRDRGYGEQGTILEEIVEDIEEKTPEDEEHADDEIPETGEENDDDAYSDRVEVAEEPDPFAQIAPSLTGSAVIVWVWKGKRLLWCRSWDLRKEIEHFRILIESLVRHIADGPDRVYIDTPDPSCISGMVLDCWLPGRARKDLEGKQLLIPGSPPRLMALTAFLGSGRGKKGVITPPQDIELSWLKWVLNVVQPGSMAEFIGAKRKPRNFDWLFGYYEKYIQRFNSYMKKALLDSGIPAGEKINYFYSPGKVTSFKNKKTVWRKLLREESKTNSLGENNGRKNPKRTTRE